MKNDQTLTGTLVLVQPDVEFNEPAKAQIGVLTYARSEAENYVKFPESGEAFYPAQQVLMLRDKQEVFDDLTKNGSAMPIDDFKAMYKIMLLQDKGTSQSLYAALAIVKDYPAVQERVMESISREQVQQVSTKYGR